MCSSGCHGDHGTSSVQISVLGSKRFENNQTANLQRILVECQGIQELMNERKMSVKEEDEENRPITGKSKKVGTCIHFVN